MSNTPKKRKTRTPDPAKYGFGVMQHIIEATGDAPEEPSKPVDPKKNPAAVELGRLGGKKGGKARAAKLSPKKRQEIAKKAAKARWKK